jgi:hypothetical protein
MGATEDFLAEMQKRRQMQMQHIQQLFGRQAAPPIPVGAEPAKPSQIMGLVKQGIVGDLLKDSGAGAGSPSALAGLKSLAGGFSNTLPVSAGAQSFLASQGASVPAGLSTGGSGVLGGLQSAGQAIGGAASGVGSALGSAAAAAPEAIGGALGAAGSALGAGASAVGGAAASALSWLAALL